MNLYQEITFAIVLGVLFFLLDVLTSDTMYDKCNPIQMTMALHLIHHILTVIMYVAWMSSNKIVLILYVILMLIILLK